MSADRSCARALFTSSEVPKKVVWVYRLAHVLVSLPGLPVVSTGNLSGLRCHASPVPRPSVIVIVMLLRLDTTSMKSNTEESSMHGDTALVF